MVDVLIVAAMVTAILGFRVAILRNAAQRHARYRMRVKLAQAIWSGQLQELRVGKKGQTVAK